MEGECCRLLACKALTRGSVTVGCRFSVIGRCSGLERVGNPGGQSCIFGEAATEGGKVAAQLFNEALSLKLNRLRVALQWTECLVKLLLA